MDTALRMCIFLTCIAGGVTATLGGKTQKCPITYYIHEYNVNPGRASGSTATTEKPLISPPVLAGGEFVSRDHLYKERQRWQRRLHHLQTHLVAEKTKRLEQLDRFLEVRSQETASSSNATSDSQKPQADRGGNTLHKEDVKAILNKADRTTRTEQFSSDERAAATTINALQIELLLGTFKENFTKSLAKLTSELGSVRRKYLHVYRANKRLSLDYHRLRQDVGMSKGQMGRLQLFQQSEIQRLKWRLGNETEMCRNATASMEERVAQLCVRTNDTGCPSQAASLNNVKIEKIDPNVVTEQQREERRLSYEEKSHTKGINNDAPSSLTAVSAVSTDVMVDAGIRVSKWYLDYIASQRPKG